MCDGSESVLGFLPLDVEKGAESMLEFHVVLLGNFDNNGEIEMVTCGKKGKLICRAVDFPPR